MSLFTKTQADATVRRLQMEADDAARVSREELQRQINDVRSNSVSTGTPGETPRQGINNMIRNGDHNHSVDSWFEETPTATEQLHECANAYTYPAFAPVVINDAAMTAGSNVLDSASAPFNAAMNGRYAVVEGAGASGDYLAGVITYVSPGQATLEQTGGGAANAATTVSGAAARINLLKLTHKTRKNSADEINDTVKDPAHADYAANINDPNWHKDTGTVRLGSRNPVCYPFGRFNDDGITFVPIHQLYSGRELFCRVNVARRSKYVKAKGIYLSVYNNHESSFDFVRGSDFVLSHTLSGAIPATTATAQYLVVLETSNGFSLVSEVLTVTDAPDEAAIAQGSRVRLNWTYYAGTTKAIVYRKFAGGNVFKLEEFSTGANSYTDVNFSQKTNTGSADFPTFADAAKSVPVYFATAAGELDELAIDGVDDAWQPLEAILPFPPSVNMARVFDPHFVIGLVEPLSTEIDDAVVTNGANTLQSAAGQFVSETMAGKAFKLTNQDTGATVSGTISSVTDANNLVLSANALWTASNSILEIADSQPNGLYLDLVGVSLNQGQWDFHSDDNNRRQTVASNPNGSTQGGTTGEPPTQSGGTGGVRCVLDSALVSVKGEHGRIRKFLIFLLSLFRLEIERLTRPPIIRKQARFVQIDDLVWNGLGYEDEDFNRIEWIRPSYSREIFYLMTESTVLPCTRTHRVTNGPDSFAHGISVSALKRGKNLLILKKKKAILERVSALPSEKGLFRVISFGLQKNSSKKTAHLLVINDVISHNRKLDTDLEPPVN